MAVSPDPIKTIFPALTKNGGFQIQIQLIFWRIQFRFLPHEVSGLKILYQPHQ